MLLNFVRNHLVNQGIVRVPQNAGALPPLWLEPRHGVPEIGMDVQNLAPAEKSADLQIGAWQATGEGTVPLEGELDVSYVLFRFLSRTTPVGFAVHQQIRAAIDDKRNWSMAGQQVHSSQLFRSWQFISSDDEGFNHLSEYRIVTWFVP
jgi:hypothetical protein